MLPKPGTRYKRTIHYFDNGKICSYQDTVKCLGGPFSDEPFWEFIVTKQGPGTTRLKHLLNQALKRDNPGVPMQALFDSNHRRHRYSAMHKFYLELGDIPLAFYDNGVIWTVTLHLDGTEPTNQGSEI